MSFKYTSRHHAWYAAQVPHGTAYVVHTLSLMIRPVWPSTYEELVSLSQKKTDITGCIFFYFWLCNRIWLVLLCSLLPPMEHCRGLFAQPACMEPSPLFGGRLQPYNAPPRTCALFPSLFSAHCTLICYLSKRDA